MAGLSNPALIRAGHIETVSNQHEDGQFFEQWCDHLYNKATKNKRQTRLSLIESQPKNVVVVVFAVIIIVGHKNLILKLGQNWVNKGSIVIDISLF